jgi:putative tricarboxylic transport membrane protein
MRFSAARSALWSACCPASAPLAGISILLAGDLRLDATKAIVMLAGIYYGSQYGGSTTSILMRIPGEAASVMTCIDGYAMAQKGRAGAACASPRSALSSPEPSA